MQPGGGRGDGALVAREQRLIVGPVLVVGSAAQGDVGRERHRAPSFDRLVEGGAGKIEDERHLALFSPRLDRGCKVTEETDIASVAEPNAVPGFQSLRRSR